MKKKILIFGGTGLLGTNLVYNLQDKFEIILNFHNKKFFSKHIKYIKIIDTKNTDIKEIEKKIKSVNPNIIINCVANTDLEHCEKNQKTQNFQTLSYQKFYLKYLLKIILNLFIFQQIIFILEIKNLKVKKQKHLL